LFPQDNTRPARGRPGAGKTWISRPESGEETNLVSSELEFSKLGGLLPAVVQDVTDGRVLMVGFMNEESFQKTVETGKVTFFSRSRNELWTKGGSSGHYLVVKDIQVDCDLDSLLIQVEALGPGVCHNGFRSCFYRRLDSGKWQQSEEQAYDPNVVYKSGR
jgi:phosphoribosyl-AMP cyclohydrolase